MNTEDKQKLVDAINCKFPQNNIMELYYDIGRVLPFTAQRFPDGRVSDWYRNQYVQVVRVEPHGRFGKYGTAYGFYYRNGERAIVQTHQNYVGVRRTIRNLSQYQTADAAPGHYLKYREKVQKSMKLKYSDWMMCLHLENIRTKLLEKLLIQTGTM